MLKGEIPKATKETAAQFHKLPLGQVTISNAGRHLLHVRPTMMKGDRIMELKSVELKPVED